MKNLFVNIFAGALVLVILAGCASEGTVEDTTPVNDGVGAVMNDPAAGSIPPEEVSVPMPPAAVSGSTPTRLPTVPMLMAGSLPTPAATTSVSR